MTKETRTDIEIYSAIAMLVAGVSLATAGFTDEEIAPLLEKAHDVENIVLPEGW